jgi:hypothetical protein
MGSRWETRVVTKAAGLHDDERSPCFQMGAVLRCTGV